MQLIGINGKAGEAIYKYQSKGWIHRTKAAEGEKKGNRNRMEIE